MEDDPKPMADFFVGTSGYSYVEWIDAGFYPQGTPTRGMLPLYARHFSVMELNYTWYQMPRAPAIERMCSRVPKGFKFAAKLTRTLTHEINPDLWKNEVALYRQGMAPLVQSGRLFAVLVQLPPFFTRSLKHRHYLAALLDELSGLPLAVEFRHDSWATDTVLAGLEERKVALVCVDEPALPHFFPTLDAVTNPDFFYIRFHGKNASGWRSGSMQKQFDYDYSDRELKGWVETRIRPMGKRAKAGGIFFNNHVRGQAPKNALQLIELLQAL